MLIEPEALLMFAERAGLKLYRNGPELLIHYRNGIQPHWVSIFREMKAQLLPNLPEAPADLLAENRNQSRQITHEKLEISAIQIPRSGEQLEMFEAMPNLGNETGNPKRKLNPLVKPPKKSKYHA